MTGSLILYSLVFMRYSMAVTPQNYLLFGCHFVNELAQLSQGFRWVKHHYDTSSNDGEDTKKDNSKLNLIKLEFFVLFVLQVVNNMN